MKHTLITLVWIGALWLSPLANSASPNQSQSEEISSAAKPATSNRSRAPALSYYDDPERMDALWGADRNQNGVRDDYEKAIASSSLPLAVKPYALAAGKVYAELIATAKPDFQVTPDNARFVLERLLLANACKREMQALHRGQAWQKSAFFDTWDRIEANHKLQSRLVRVVDEARIPYPTESPCTELLSLGAGL